MIPNHRKARSEPEARRKVRCAVYTRKSTEEGLEQEFNSLDAQRESGEAYVRSQASEGWVLLPKRYDDGGFSGGNIERPALAALLRDIEDGKVDCVVVYKVDRLSRSLMDFTRIVEVFERKGVSFVSVTQQFNTANSMGRLTLNVLLSFAQFEREIIGERIRDKIAAQRRKGKWAGGKPVLGYDVDRSGPSPRLVVNEREANAVRSIFRTYLEAGSVLLAVQELARRGILTKRWRTKKGAERGGKPIGRVTLHGMLTNELYLGRILHRGASFPGEHPPIVDPELFDRVRARLATNGKLDSNRFRNRHNALLHRLVHCSSCGGPMTHVVAGKAPRLYRYYTCVRARNAGACPCRGSTLPAGEIEQAVVEEMRDFCKRPEVARAVRAELAKQGGQPVGESMRLLADFDRVWSALEPSERVRLVALLVARVDFDRQASAIDVSFHDGVLAAPGLEEAA